MDSTLLGPAGFTLSTEEQPTLKGPHAWTPQSLTRGRGGLTPSFQQEAASTLTDTPCGNTRDRVIFQSGSRVNVKLRTFGRAAEMFSSLWSFDKLGVLRGIGRLAEQVLPFMLRAAVLQEQHARRHNQTQRTRRPEAAPLVKTAADVNS